MPDSPVTQTRLHIKRVAELMSRCAVEILQRGLRHDNSKLEDPERSIFDAATHKLEGLTYGTQEYKDALESIRPALLHHYEHNSHHPEHYRDGVDGMDLFDVMEMLMDWKAAGERHKDGTIEGSLKVNRERFGISSQLMNILNNTIYRMKLNTPQGISETTSPIQTHATASNS